MRKSSITESKLRLNLVNGCQESPKHSLTDELEYSRPFYSTPPSRKRVSQQQNFVLLPPQKYQKPCFDLTQTGFLNSEFVREQQPPSNSAMDKSIPEISEVRFDDGKSTEEDKNATFCESIQRLVNKMSTNNKLMFDKLIQAKQSLNFPSFDLFFREFLNYLDFFSKNVILKE